jgi:hypothetical protein
MAKKNWHELTLGGRVGPVLKEAIQGGKINLTAILNTHQLVTTSLLPTAAC